MSDSTGAQQQLRRAHGEGHRKKNEAGLGPFRRGDRGPVRKRGQDHAGHGQPEHPLAGIAVRDVCARQGQGAMGQVRVRVHPEARELAQHGRDRVERARGAVAWTEESTTPTWSAARSRHGRHSETTRTHGSIGGSSPPTRGSSYRDSIRHSTSDTTREGC